MGHKYPWDMSSNDPRNPMNKPYRQNTGHLTCDSCGADYDYAPDSPPHFCDPDARTSNRIAELENALRRVVADVKDYERVNNLQPNPGRFECWESVAHAKAILAKWPR